MAFLVDTSVLARLANSADPFYSVAANAILELHRRRETLYIAPQSLIEFRNAATRPKSVNGLGLTVDEARAKAAIFEAAFSLAPETPDIFPAWKALVDGLGVIGKQVHDARLVGTCHVHSISHLLTFNVGHFARLAGAPPGIIVVDPASL